jgi:hypothetical protein
MNENPPVAPELWQQIPPPVQSALVEAFARAEQRCQTLEEQLRQAQARLGPTARLADFPSLKFDKPEIPSPVLPTQPAQPSHGRRRRRHRSPKGRFKRWRQRAAEHLFENLSQYLFWLLVVVASALALWWVAGQLISPGGLLSVR